MLKKLIIYLLVASILFTIPVVYAGTEETADKTYTVYLFESLGIIDNAAEYVSRFDESMTRGEFAILAAGLYNGVGYTKGYQAFRDVSDTHSAAKAVNLLASNGIISGTSGNNFEPDRAIEYNEALSIVLKMLGYGDFIGYNGGYPTGCHAVVNKFKLFAYSDLTADSTVGNIFELLYETVKENVMEITSIGSGYNNSDINREKTILGIYFDIYHTEGILTSDGFVNLKSTDLPDRNEIAIDGITYQTNGELYDFIGQNVICFYKETDNIKKTAVYVAPTEENNILTVDGDRAYEFSNMVFKYEKENGRADKIKLTNDVDAVYNYTVATKLSEDIILPKDGTVTFVDNDNNGDYDVVIIKSYVSFIVSAMSTHDDGVILYGATERNIPNVNITADGEKDTLIYKDGAKLTTADIKPGMVASVAGILENGELKAKEVILCNKTMYGDITGFEVDGNDIRLLIDDEVYNVTDSFMNIAKKAGYRYSVNFYLDFMGDIVDIAEADMTMLDLALGYIIDVNYDESGFDDVFQIKMLTEASKIVVYDVNETVKIDGITCKGTKEVFNNFDPTPQLVAYKISENRKINYIDTASVLDGEIKDDYYNRLTLTVPRTKSYYQKEQFSFDGDITMDANTRVFVIPENIESAQDIDFEVIKNTDVAGSLNYTVESYSLNNDKITADAVIMQASAQTMPTSSVAMAIKQISNVINADGEETYAVTLMGMKGEEKYLTVDHSIIDAAPAQSDADKKTYKLGVGDIVRVTTNKENEINKIMLVYDYSTGEIKNGMVFSGSYFSRSRAAKASVYNIQGEYMQITDYDLSTLGSGEYLDHTSLENQKLSKFTVVKYDTTRGKLDIVKGSAADLISYKNNDVDYSKIVIYTENALERVIFVLD